MTVFEQLRSAWARTTGNQRIALAGLVGVAAIVAFVAFNAASAPDYAVAFTNLRDEDAAPIVAKLKETKIPYQLADRGTIKVPRAQVEEVRITMAAAGLGQKGGATAGMELFSQPHFGMTEFAEKINYQRALEGELSRTIARLDAVESARVHLVVPSPTLFTANQKEPSASVVIQPKPGRRLDPTQLQGITQLVAGSVEGLKAQNITLMDTVGNVLSERSSGTDLTRDSDRRVEVQRGVEARIEDDVTRMLARVLGPGKAIIRVGAELDWDQYEANSEIFSPGTRAPQIRTQRESTESSRGGTAAGGVPGADTSVPIYAGSNGVQGASAQDRHDTTTTYELSKTVEKTTRAPGGIKRLSVAVALDSEVIADVAQVDAISKLVATAASLDTNRGDVVTLTAMPFAAGAESISSPAVEAARQMELMLTAARIAAMVLGPLVLLLVFRLILGRRSAKSTAAATAATTFGSAAALNQALQLQEPRIAPIPGLTSEEREHQRMEKEISRTATTDPSMVAQIIRTWLREDSGVA